MKYIENSLSPNEAILITGKIHWFVFVPGVLVTLIGYKIYHASTAFPGVGLLGSVLIALGLLDLLLAVIAKTCTELAVTTQQVIAKFGFISRRTIEMNNAKVESIKVDQSILGRIFGYGTLTVSGTGGVGTPIPTIVDPLKFRLVAKEQIERVQATPSSIGVKLAEN